MKNLKEILYQEKQSIDANNSEHQTATLAAIFHKPAGKQIHMTSLDTSHRQFSNTTEENLQYQLILILLM